ncbi:MAG: metallophosphoesterase [Rikenellaceae bacterium]
MKLQKFVGLFLLLTSVPALSQVRPLQVELTDSESFSMVVIPDVQSYVKFKENQPILDLMTIWTEKHLKKLNVKTVLCTGDLVEQNEIRIPHGAGGDQTSLQQWEATSRAFAALDNKTPYIVCTGNHDYGYQSAENRMSRFPEYFTSERNFLWEETLVEVGLDSNGVPTLENAAYAFDDPKWGKLMVLVVEFAPRDAMMEWARTIANKYKEHRIILLTHSFMEGGASAERYIKEGYKIEDANYGQQIWDELVKVSPNISFVLCGHACNLKGFEQNVSFRVDKNQAGKKIPQMMFNAQTADGQWMGNGGDGWLRILEFMPDGETVKVRTFSPLFAISPTTADKAWRTESFDEFEFKIPLI